MPIAQLNLNNGTTLKLKEWAARTNQVIAASNVANTNLNSLIANTNIIISDIQDIELEIVGIENNLNSIIANVNILISNNSSAHSDLQDNIDALDLDLQGQINVINGQISTLTTNLNNLTNLVNSFVTVTSSHITFKVNGVNQLRVHSNGTTINRDNFTAYYGSI